MVSCSTTEIPEVFEEKPYQKALELTRNFDVLGEYDGTWSALCPGRVVVRIPNDRREEPDLCPPTRVHAEDWCYARERPAMQTIEWLKNLYGVDDCFEMYSILRKKKNIEIAGEGAESLTDLGPLFELHNLESLKLKGSSFRYLKILKTLKGLKVLEIEEGAWLRSAVFLKSLKNLTKLTLISKEDWGVELPDLSDLDDLKSVYIRHLMGGLKAFQDSSVKDIRVEFIDHLEGLGTLDDVEKINIQKCQSGYVPPLESLSDLRVLRLKWCEIQQMPLIEDMDSLKNLDLSYNEIRKIEFLGDHDLTVLSLKNNQISDVEPLRHLSSLKKLDLRDNPEVRNLEPLRELSELRKILLQGTRIYRVWKGGLSRDRYRPFCPIDSEVTKSLRDFCRS